MQRHFLSKTNSLFSSLIRRRSMSTSTISQPAWIPPSRPDLPSLKVYNSLTRKKDTFIPDEGNHLSWYCCGPTVYDKSHMGHARAYITFDILRRLMENYFGYHVQYVMNITDIDDKIIREARYKFLFDRLKASQRTPTDDLVVTLTAAWTEYTEKKLGLLFPNVSVRWPEFVQAAAGKAVQGAADEPKFELYVKTATRALDAIKNAREMQVGELLDACRDVIAPYLDAKEGASVTDQKIFRDFAAHWETAYFKDMDDLNILRPNVLTRVSEYVPEIVEFVQGIIKNGFGYEMEGSVYFDTVKFDQTPEHDYAKLEPWSAGNVKLLQEGEGDLTKEVKGKKNNSDFALWKASKAGEPAWSSPWGQGRPGWHIECSAMAGAVLGQRLDIHSGGIDLAFPHHDNEIAQCEGYFNCKQWVNYFLHAGHLHIEGQKMSKSLKNFVTIQEALETYTAAQIRLFFLLHSWESVLDYSAASMAEAKTFETFVHNFLLTVKAVAREQSGSHVFTGAHNFHAPEKALTKLFHEKQTAIHKTLCDSFNTPATMSELKALISASNTYYQESLKSKRVPNGDLLSQIGGYISKLLRIFGVYTDVNPLVGPSSAESGGGANYAEETVFPYAEAFSMFRDRVRSLAQSKADSKAYLELCDEIRDQSMVELGISVEDRGGEERALVKLVDRLTLIEAREEKAQRESEKAREKAERAAALEAKRLDRLERGRTHPKDMFKTLEFSAWDEEGLPTLDAAGQEVSKSRRKKAEKEAGAQAKLHAEFLAEMAK